MHLVYAYSKMFAKKIVNIEELNINSDLFTNGCSLYLQNHHS